MRLSHFLFVTCSIAPFLAQANMIPVFKLTGGLAHTSLQSRQTLTLLPPLQNDYNTRDHSSAAEMGGLIGFRTDLKNDWQTEFGISYYSMESLAVKGDIDQFSNPTYNNLKYQYAIKNQRILLEGKLLSPKWHHMQPFFAIGAGESRNQAYAYREIPLQGNVAPMQSPFSSFTRHAFTYFVGLGAEIAPSPHIRLGLNYRFADLGRANLGPSAMQATNDHLQQSHLSTHEFLFQITYVG